MKPVYARTLTEEEWTELRQNQKSSNGFTVRRAQMILISADERLKVDELGRRIGCQGQAVRQAIHAFHQEGLSCLKPKAKGNPTDRRALDDAARERLRELIRRSPATWAMRPACGRWIYWRRRVLNRASWRRGLQVKPSGRHWQRWVSTGGGSSSSFIALTRTTRSKKAARVAETAGTAAPRLVVGGGR